MKRKIRVIVLSLAIVVFLFSAYKITAELVARQKEKEDFDKLSQFVGTGELTEPGQIDYSDTAPVETEPYINLHNLVLLMKDNPDCVGWLIIPGTNINHPVMFTPKNPEKYLRLDFYGKYSVSGVPFIDGRCSLTETNLIVYGHNMRNGTMFSDISKLLDRDFRSEHSTVYFYDADGKHAFKIDKVLSTTIYDDVYRGVKLQGTRKLVLSTCHRNSEVDRLVLIASELSD